MSEKSSECPRCSLYRGEVALLRGEIASLRNSVLALTKPPDDGKPVLEIVGMHEAERLAMTGPFVDDSDVWYRVSLTYRDQVSAQCLIPISERTEFLRFFEDLARHKQGWEGTKQIVIREGQLVISCLYEGKLFRPEVSMDVSCALEIPSFDPYWTVHLHLDVDPDALENLAAQARILFGNTATELSEGVLQDGPSLRVPPQ